MEKKLCSFDGCNGKFVAKGLCGGHYQQARKGIELSPLSSRAGKRAGLVKPDDYFWSRVDKTDNCWEWTGTKLSTGYGRYKLQGIIEGAHRHSYKKLVGPIPDGMVIDHLCHNAGCVNPEHLRIASHSENMQNLRGAQVNNSAGLRGVHSDVRRGKYRAAVQANGKRHFFGWFDDPNEAAQVSQQARIRLHGLP